jgi:NADPH-dependent 2,4-dienoyl-CoA reductase/sulfur reductase-like enzyme
MNRGLVIVGGGPAAYAAAEAFRARGGTGPVVLVLAEGRHPYNRPPLSKELLRGEAGEHELPLEAPGWYAERHVALRPGVAAALDLERRAVVLEDGDGLPYDTCVLATGAAPVPPPIEGTGEAGVHLLRTAEHSLALRAAAEPGLEAVIVGSGFIGCEAAASLRARGCRVTLVSQEPAPQTGRLGPAVAARLAGWLEEEGVTAHYGTDVERIDRRGGRLSVATAGPELTADLVLLASGVRARTRLAAEAGLALADRGEIPVDAHMRADAPGVLACGDCALAHNAAAGRPLHVEHWGDALGQGAVAGATAAGAEAAWDDVPGFWSTIGARTLKYAAWGDGFDAVRLDANGAGFTAWYARAGRCVGVLTHERDADYEGGRELIAAGEPPP